MIAGVERTVRPTRGVIEYKSHVLTKLAGGNPYRGCYALAVTIFGIGIVRDYLYVLSLPALCLRDLLTYKRYNIALQHQPTHPLLETDLAKLLAVVLFAVGGTLVLSSMWALGVTGTYLGKRDLIIVM